MEINKNNMIALSSEEKKGKEIKLIPNNAKATSH